MTAISNGVTAFRESFFDASIENRENFSDFSARQMRYQVLWAYYENTAYRRAMYRWVSKYLADHGLYQYIRDIYNPGNRLGEFWTMALLGGVLDPNAGDGKSIPSALPIVTENELLRPVISDLWRVSNFQIKKSVFARYGAVLGDTALRVRDDTKRQRVYLEVTHPGTLRDVTLDAYGNVKGYIVEEIRKDPRKSDGSLVTYTEIATRDNAGGVVFKTLLDQKPYAWNGVADTWTEMYGFVPLVVVQHLDVGLAWGYSEMQSILSKVREADDAASALSDAIRRKSNPLWLFNFARSSATVKVSGTNPDDPDSLDDQEGRQELAALYIDEQNAKAQPLVADLEIAGAVQHIASILSYMERERPELRQDIWDLGNDTSGKALRIRREPVEARVVERRTGYDDAIVRAHMMAISIGAQRGYKGFKGFSESSFANGELAHSIGSRPVFRKDVLDDLEFQQTFWTVAKAAQDAGDTLASFLARNQWSEQDIAEIENSPERQMRDAAMRAAFGQDQNQNDG